MVEIEFENEELSDIYQGHKTPKGYQPDVVKGFIKTVNILKASKNIEELYKFKSLNFESLTNRKGIYSVRVNNKYRIEFKYKVDGSITVITIIKLSNHYK